MRASLTHQNVLEERFPHLVPRQEEGGGRTYRSPSGREVFSLDADGRKLRLPVARQLLIDLFGGLPFPVEARDGASVICLPDIEDQSLLFNLIEALEEQSGASAAEPSAAAPQAAPGRVPDKEEGARRSTRLVRVLVVAAVLLLAVFLAFSWRLAQRSLDRDREQWIETLLRR